MTIENEQLARPVEPRYFWRRAIAFVVDMLIASLLAALLFLAIYSATGVNLGVSGLAFSRHCVQAPPNHPQVSRIEKAWSLQPGEVRSNLLCRTTAWGGPSFDSFLTQVVRKDGAVTYTRHVTYLVDADGKEIAYQISPDFSLLPILLYFVVFTASGRRTPGKTVFSLRAVATGGERLSGSAVVEREGLKLLPLVVMLLLQLWSWISPPAMLTSSDAMIVAVREGTFATSKEMIVTYGTALLTLVWWFGPFLLWRGRTWYDMIAGAKVIKTK